MRPTQHPSNTTTLDPPPGASHEECVPLAVTRVTDDSGRDCVQSYWQPTQEERAAIAGGALILFHAWGVTHPPVWLGVEGCAWT